jgi:hypothetical protein
MLLSHRFRFLFVHIAKTGGTSIRAALKPYLWRDPWFVPMFFLSRLSHLSGHQLCCKLPRHAKAICAYEMLPREFYDSLFKFVFVRNPWDLQVSSYHHLKRERPYFLEGKNDFESFLRYKFDPNRPFQYHLDIASALQSDYILNMQGQVIVDFIGRYETLEEDFALVCQTLKIPALKLPEKRKAQARKDYRHYYNDDLAELVRVHYAEDISRFDYHF